jgi:hypothetical protein
MADATAFGQWKAAQRLLDAALRSDAHELADWLHQHDARSATGGS